MKLVITNEDSDLDGAASSYAYAEYLKKRDERAVGARFGELNQQTQNILEELDESIPDASYYLYSADEIVIVSASSMEKISARIPPEKVVGIIDHENIHAEDFPNAELEIEDVSTASTIIAEKFRDNDIEISHEAATLLYEAIKSTVEELDGDEATDRDRKMLEWLEEQKK